MTIGHLLLDGISAFNSKYLLHCRSPFDIIKAARFIGCKSFNDDKCCVKMGLQITYIKVLFSSLPPLIARHVSMGVS